MDRLGADAYRQTYTARDGRQILVRPTAVEDAPAFHEVQQQPEVLWGTLQVPFTPDETYRRMLEGNASNPGFRALCAEIDGRAVGFSSLGVSKAVRRRHVGEIGMSVHRDYRGNRIGTALMSAIIQLADEWYNLHRLTLEVFVENRPAIALYEKFGFVIEGTMIDDVFQCGAFTDTHIMGRVRPLRAATN